MQAASLQSFYLDLMRFSAADGRARFSDWLWHELDGVESRGGDVCTLEHSLPKGVGLETPLLAVAREVATASATSSWPSSSSSSSPPLPASYPSSESAVSAPSVSSLWAASSFSPNLLRGLARDSNIFESFYSWASGGWVKWEHTDAFVGLPKQDSFATTRMQPASTSQLHPSFILNSTPTTLHVPTTHSVSLDYLLCLLFFSAPALGVPLRSLDPRPASTTSSSLLASSSALPSTSRGLPSSTSSRRRLDNSIRVLLVGPSNSGKSTALSRLLGEVSKGDTVSSHLMKIGGTAGASQVQKFVLKHAEGSARGRVFRRPENRKLLVCIDDLHLAERGNHNFVNEADSSTQEAEPKPLELIRQWSGHRLVRPLQLINGGCKSVRSCGEVEAKSDGQKEDACWSEIRTLSKGNTFSYSEKRLQIFRTVVGGRRIC
eukprot:GHVT01032918.1.p1 GENE.GHVT01032918.1~~GHVT01032918.1.p1  ORF type:complete len:433 (+),score=71.06 GHVT01032918.1:990-2288(+)